jgi:Putative transposase
MTIPRLLRPLFRRRRDLLTELARAGAEATIELVRRTAGRDLRPGLVVSLATAGDLLQWHPHLHLLASDGGFAVGGRFVSLAQWDATLLMSLFRERILARLLDRHAISRELVQELLAWRHPGFSAHVGEALFSQDKQRLEDTAAYLVRNPLLCGRPHRRGYADLAIMRTIACAGTGVTRQYSEMRAVVDSRWSA